MAQEKILGNQLNITTVADEIAADPTASTTLASGMNLNELADVTAGSPTAGQVLTYSNSPAGWQPQDAAAGGGSVTNPLSSDLDVGGYEITGVDTAGSPSAGSIAIISGASTFAGAGSYAGKVTIKGGDRLYEGDYTGVIPAGSPVNRNSVSILAGSGSGYGGGIELIAGTTGGQYGEGGDINITAGEATHATNGYSGNVFLRGGNHSGTYYLGNGGNVDLHGGYSTHGAGGSVRLFGGNSAGYGGAGSIILTAGSAQLAGSPGPAQQYAGFVRITAGNGSLDAGGTTPGGQVDIKAGSASTGGNADGGAIVLTPGFGQGTGVHGTVSIIAELEMNSRNVRDVKGIYYNDEQDIGAATTVSFTNRTHIKASPSGATTYAFSVFGFLRTGHYQLKLVNGLNNNPTWPTTVKWQNNTEPTWTANTDIISFYFDFLTGNYYAINVALGFV